MKNTNGIEPGLTGSPFFMHGVKLFVKTASKLNKMYFMKLGRTPLAVCFLLLGSLLFFACQKETGAASSRARLQVYLTDDPGNFEEVVIDVQDIKVNYSSDSSQGWESLSNVKRGSYNILDLVNDKDTLLGDADLAAGRIEQIRLVLGPGNYVKVDGQTYLLQTPSAQQSGLKLNIHQDINAGITYKLLLDFDAARSIVKTGNNKYLLKPVIRTTLEAAGGSIRGFVLPDTVSTAVFALQGTDTVAGTYTANGSFFLKSLQSGTYTLAFVPSDTSYQSQNKPGIVVTNNNVTTVDTVTLVK
jgi:hypothetical protein